MKTLNIAVCEDMPEDALLLRRLIGQSGIAVDVFTYESGESFLSVFKPGAFQLVLLDIYLGGLERSPQVDHMDGMDVALKIRESDTDVWLAFTTISDDYVVPGYKVNAKRYLKKPLDAWEVKDLVQQAVRHWEGFSDEIFITVDRRRRGISPRDVMYVEASGKQSVIHLRGETLVAYITIDHMEKLLSMPSFLRCHRGYIVNMDYVKEAGRDFIMANGAKAYISRTNLWKMRRAYRDYLVHRVTSKTR